VLQYGIYDTIAVRGVDLVEMVIVESTVTYSLGTEPGFTLYTIRVPAGTKNSCPVGFLR
jgi:hypothetical protein